MKESRKNEKKNIIKIVSILIIIILLVNLTLLAFRIIEGFVFWIIILICFIGAYFVKKNKEKG